MRQIVGGGGGSGISAEEARDAIGNTLVAGNNIDLTVDDGADTITVAVETLTLADISDITASAAEVNVLDGVTASTTELNYTDGVTSAIQTQIDTKANDADVVHDTGAETIAGVKTFSSDPIIPDEAYGVGWNASLEPPTKNAVYDKIEALVVGGGGLTLEEVYDALGGGVLVAGNNIDITHTDGSDTIEIAVETLTKADVGLANVDNTADAAKPVSTAQQTALDAKAPIASPTFTGTVAGITKSMVGLGNVDNTADSAKPVSTAQQTALDAKANDADVVHDTGAETIAGVKTFSSDPLIPDEAYGVAWNGSLEPPTKNAVYDKIETISAGGGAPTDATYITQTANASLSNEQALGSLATGILKNTTTTGVLSIATAGTDYETAGTSATHAALTNNPHNVTADQVGFGTDDSPQLTALNLGHATDTTIARVSAGVISVEGAEVTTLANATTGTGSIVRASSPALTTPNLGTPSALTLTNATGLPVAGITASTATALGVGSVELGHATDTTITRSAAGVIAVEGVTVPLNSTSGTLTTGTIELGHATDTTLSRSAAGVLAVEGVVVPTESSTNTFTNKRVTPRVNTSADAATHTINSDTTDFYTVTAQAQAFTMAAPSGTPTGGQRLMVRIKDNGTARGITWTTGSSGAWRAIGVTLPTTTVLSKTHYIGAIWNATDSRWDVLATAVEA